MKPTLQLAQLQTRRHFCIVLVVASFFSAAVVADDAARGIVERAIKAQGGATKVAKLRVMRIKAEGTMVLVPGQPGVPFVIEDWWQMPDQYKSTSKLELGGKKVSQTQTIDGDGGWIQIDGASQAMPKEAVVEMREQRYAEDLDRLGFLDDKGIDVTILAEAKVGGRAVVGVLLKSKGHRDVKLYFDKETSLLAKREHRLLDGATGKEVVQVVEFSDYKETDGVKHYRAMTVSRDGKKLAEAKIVELEFFGKLDKKTFAKP